MNIHFSSISVACGAQLGLGYHTLHLAVLDGRTDALLHITPPRSLKLIAPAAPVLRLLWLTIYMWVQGSTDFY